MTTDLLVLLVVAFCLVAIAVNARRPRQYDMPEGPIIVRYEAITGIDDLRLHQFRSKDEGVRTLLYLADLKGGRPASEWEKEALR